MDTNNDNATGGAPVVAGGTAPANIGPSWVRRNAWPLGGMAAVFTLGGWWWRRRRRRQLDVGPVTEAWLEAHEYEAGQAGDRE
jgi:hypothetical protein